MAETDQITFEFDPFDPRFCDEARFITGQVLNVDGGMRMHTSLYGEQIAPA
jgi:hypothetical protein